MTDAPSVEAIAAWAHALQPGDIPAAVGDLCRAQRDSVLAASAASFATDAATRRVVSGVIAGAADGPFALPGVDRRVGLDDALYAACAASIALDFDDYACFGHTGHSAVLVPELVGAATGASQARRLVAQVVANEIEARLGGACLVGPLNGQLWGFIHAAGAALAAGLLFDLTEQQLAHALAISLYQAPRPTVPGFMAPDSKLLTAAEPTVAGVRAARLAEAGVTGPLDVLDHDHGVLTAFAHAPVHGLLGRLGAGWATRTLCIKAYPGCAYIDTTIDALLSLELPPADEVASVSVEAGLLTCGMDAMSSEWAAVDPTPVTVNFSIPWNVAITLLAGRLTPAEVNTDWLAAHRATLAGLAARVSLHHDWSLTAHSAEAFAPVLPVGRLVGDAGTGKLLRGLGRVRGDHAGLPVGFNDVAGLAKLVVGGPRVLSAVRGRPFWDDDALTDFRMTFPSRVRVRTHGGRELVAEAGVPAGGAGHPATGPAAVAAAKVAAHGRVTFGDGGR